MSTDYRALCADLLDWAERTSAHYVVHPDVILRARATLAQSEPEGVTDEALANFSGWFCRNYPGPDTIIHKPEWHAPKVFRAAADAIARYARPTIQPVLVSERLPGPEDCDAEGRCWYWHPGEECWEMVPVVTGTLDIWTHWLPHYALPTP